MSIEERNLKLDYEHAGRSLDRNRKKTVKLLKRLRKLERDRAFWLRESERTTDALYKMRYPDE